MIVTDCSITVLNDFLKVIPKHWNKCPFHQIIENNTARHSESYVKVFSHEAYDNSLARERL